MNVFSEQLIAQGAADEVNGRIPRSDSKHYLRGREVARLWLEDGEGVPLETFIEHAIRCESEVKQ